MKHLKLFEDIDPFGEEEWEEKERIVMPITWSDYSDDPKVRGYLAKVGKLYIGAIFKAWKWQRKFIVKVGFGEDNFNDDMDFKTDNIEEAKKYIEDWWNSFINKITY